MARTRSSAAASVALPRPSRCAASRQRTRWFLSTAALRSRWVSARTGGSWVPGFAEHVLDAYDEAANGRIAAAVAGVRGGKVGIGIFAAPYPCPPAPFELALVLHERFETLGVPAEIEVFSALPASVPILGQAGCEAFDARLDAV